jgi:N-sulfoglucosamine sulfohydrolase
MKSTNYTILFASIWLCLFTAGLVATEDTRPNILLITVDDMSCDSVGAFGCELPGTTPHIDQLAKQGLRFHFAHVQTGSCYPSRNVLLSGRYSHNTGVEGFYQVKEANYPHLVDLMKDAGYFVGIRGKVSHSTPYQPYGWDADLTTLDDEKQQIKDPQSYYRSTKRGIELAKSAQKPFCLNINISDPHKPFYAMSNRGEVVDDPYVPSQIYSADEVPIPGFLFDHPEVRKELSHYYSSVRRADDCVAQILQALDESGQRKDTLIIFLSDHGMPLPFAKTAVWYHSTRTPLIICWPEVTRPGAVDRQHMVSAVDLVPTLLDLLELKHPTGLDGRSFAAALRGEKLEGHDYVYTFHNENSGRNRSPMRSIQSRRFGYIFNPWSDGKRVFRTATTGTLTYRTMEKLAEDNAEMAERLELFTHRVPEELYDYENDPAARVNLINDPDYAAVLEQLRREMRRVMVESNDPLLELFDRREDAAFVSSQVDELQAEANARRNAGRTQNASGRSQRQNQRLFKMSVPEKVGSDGQVDIQIHYNLPAALGEQAFHVTLKNAKNVRVERQVKQVSGKGTLSFRFHVPQDMEPQILSVAAFVGKDYTTHLLHRTAGPIEWNQDGSLK